MVLSTNLAKQLMQIAQTLPTPNPEGNHSTTAGHSLHFLIARQDSKREGGVDNTE